MIEENLPYNKTAVIIPTYNESENIKDLVEAISHISPEIMIIVVDDNSPDGTGKILDEMLPTLPRLNVVHRHEKSGRGGAVLVGIHLALEADKDFVFEMDADFSHDPADIPRFLSEVIQGFDVVVGSKHMSKSKIVGWNWKRKYLSLFANMFARFMLEVPLHDYTNGYRVYTREALEAIDYKRINATGYVVLSEMIYQLHKLKFRIKEIPIVFVNRRRGLSNLTWHEVTGAFAAILKVRFNEIIPT